MNFQPSILFQDDQIIAVNKDPGLLSIPDRYSPEKPNLLHLMSARFGRVITLHRLDRDTSGVIIFAKNEDSHRLISNQFNERTIEKKYLALLEGRLHQEEGIIDRPIGLHPSQSGKMIIATSGKPSVTCYKVIELFKNHTLVETDIKTGRTHQIRVHFQSIGYPLAVDPLYGRREAFYLSDVKGKQYSIGKGQIERPLISRTTLHSFSLTFTHPKTDKRQIIEAPLPKDFCAVLKQLGKWGK